MLRYVRRSVGRALAARRRAELGRFEDPRAYERSLRLLVQCLTPEQRAEFERLEAFTVRGRSGRRYRITYGSIANIEVLAPSGTGGRHLCAGPTGIPVPAVMLAQKLMLETQEAEFLRIAAQGSGTTWTAAR